MRQTHMHMPDPEGGRYAQAMENEQRKTENGESSFNASIFHCPLYIDPHIALADARACALT
jgi:hypothetical protein